jgi:HlyD family secretion protein
MNYRTSPVVSAALLAAAALALPLFAAGCDQPTAAETANGTSRTGSEGVSSGSGPRVETVRVERRDLEYTIDVPGTVRGYETADLYARVGGYLDEIAVDLGDVVKKGDVLARLHVPEMHKELRQKKALIAQAEADAAQAEAAVRQVRAERSRAEADLDEATAERAEKQAQLRYRETEFRRYEELGRSARRELLDQARYQHEAAEAAVQTVEARIRTAQARLEAAQANLARSQADLRSAEARVDVARADYEHLETLMEYAVIRAPFDGEITRRRVDPGDFIHSADGNSAAKPLLQISRLDTVRIWLDLPMADVRWLSRDRRVVLDRINALPGERFEGQVARFSAGLDDRSRMMRVEIDLENPDRRLRPGYYGYVKVFLQEYPDAPVVPTSALMADGAKRFVYVCENGRVRRQDVTTNYEDGTWVGIASGLEGGEQIVRAGGGQITDGQEVVAVLADDAGR